MDQQRQGPSSNALGMAHRLSGMKTMRDGLRRTPIRRLAAVAMAVTLSACTSSPPPAPSPVRITSSATTGDKSTDSSDVASSSVTSAATSLPEPSRRPARLTGPGSDDRPLAVLRQVPTGGIACAYAKTLLPTLALYADGAVLTGPAAAGFYCSKTPSLSAGWIDPGWATARLNAFFSSANSRTDMVKLSGTVDVADGTTTTLTYFSPGGASTTVSAYVLDMEGQLGTLAIDQARARTALKSLITDLTSKVGSTTPWTARSVNVVKPARSDLPHGDQPPPAQWPLPPSDALTKTLLSAPDGYCTVVYGRDAAALLKAQQNRTTLSPWKISGKTIFVAVGMVIPGIDPCSD